MVELLRQAGGVCAWTLKEWSTATSKLALDGRRVHIDLQALTDGRTVMICGQTEVTRDLMAARREAGAQTI